ncbi:MAG: hypothetical protein M1272_04485 [Firmicutes bacterium]|nr:hypothetical protein [Bacillota bacterium]
MKGLKDRLSEHAAVVAFGASALVFGVLSVMKARHPVALVPVVREFVPQGSRIEPKEIRWIASSAVMSAPAGQFKGYAKVPLFPGEILSPVEVGRFSSKTVIVAISPTYSIDANVAVPGSAVDVLVMGSRGVVWESGPLPVVSTSVGSSAPASVNVTMPLAKALTYERLRTGGQVELMGMTS